MALQTQNLVMVGLGILGDSPPNNMQPPLVDGIHLRWAFKQELGLPWYGYYLFRRLHRKGKPLCLSSVTTGLSAGPFSDKTLNTTYGEIKSNENLFLTDDFPPGGAVEFDLENRRYLSFTPSGGPVRLVEVRVGFHEMAKVEVIALLWDTPVTQTVVSGQAGETVTAILEFDAITEVKLSSAPAALVDLCFVPVSQEATVGWEPVPDFSYPMCLPLTHPDYPCTLGISEDLATARGLARSRIRYGDPNQFTPPPVPIYTSGIITIKNGSPIVTGAGSDWSDKLVGAILQVSGDPTAYTILVVVTPDKLVLSRSYVGVSSTGTDYAILDDVFGQVHDYLSLLVTGGTATGSMVNRSLPVPIESDGKIRVLKGSSNVTGIGTNWSEDLTGLALQVVEDTTGTISVSNGSTKVTDSGTGWSSDLSGLTLRIEGERTEYTILSIDSTTQLTLDRDYVGPTEADKAYTMHDKTPYTILSVDSPTELTIDRGYNRTTGEFGSEKAYSVFGRLQPKEARQVAPLMPRQYPLDLVLLSVLHPAIAQMIGLYWVDQRAGPGVAYDYLILSDYDGCFSGQDPHNIAGLLQQTGFSDLDGYIVFNEKMAPADRLLPPNDLRVYALPSSVRPTTGGVLTEVSNNAGLRWELGVTGEGILLPDKPFIYHLWRAGLGEGEPSDVPSPDEYQPITKDQPILVTQPRLPSGNEPQPPPDWPPFLMHAFDSGLTDGWYSYQVSGIDIFGRHSPNSTPAEWYQWKPVSEPRPWYYEEPPDNRSIHPFAVRLLDEMPPPAPTGVEAYALDPADSTVLRDTAYNAWRATLSPDERDTVIGLRVRWLWTQAHMRQAPDTREFRVYYNPGQMNAMTGRAVNVSVVSNTESDVETDIPNTHSVNAYVGIRLRVGSDVFVVVTSEAGSPLQVRIRSGPIYTDGTISVINGSTEVSGTGTDWTKDLTGLTLKVAGEQTAYTILKVEPPDKLTLNRDYRGPTDSGRAYIITGKIPRSNAPCTLVIPPNYTAGKISLENDSPTVIGTETGWRAELADRTLKVVGESAEYTIVGVDSDTQQLTLDSGYEGMTGSGKAYVIRHPFFVDYSKVTSWEKRIHVVGYDEHWTPAADGDLRHYEVFLLAPDIGEGEAFAPSLANPIVYAHIGVSAADDKSHTPDDPKWDTGEWGGRFGNEGRVGAPPKVFRVLRQPPPAPEVPPPDSDKVFATPADYYSRSYYTYRWQPQQDLKTHIFRALDDTLFKVDWKRRETSTESISADDQDYFPVEWSDPEPPDPHNPSLVEKREQIANDLNHINTFSHDAEGTAQAMAYYRELSNDVLRVLAGLPGNERAFTQLTIQPLDREDPDIANRKTPADPDDFEVGDSDNPLASETLRIYIDTLDGRSSNHYFYRAAYMDGAHNNSQLSISSPPVYLPNVVPPRAPVITKVVGGDRKITLKWASNREPDLKEYRVYRADSKEMARDLRLMALIHTEPPPDDGSTVRQAEVEWTDNPDTVLKTFYYGVVSVDETGNLSKPSAIVAGRAFDESLPQIPELSVTWTDDDLPKARASILS